MAQWAGQYSGHTPRTRVQNVEDSLRRAVRAFKAAPSERERRTKARSVRNLAKRLLSARRQMRRARLVNARGDATKEAFERRAREIRSLREQEAGWTEQGVAGILCEFDARDAIATS